VRVLPGEDRVRELSERVELGINRAEVTVGLATVAGIVIAIEPTLLALIQAVAGPAVVIREVEDGPEEREVALVGVKLANLIE